VPDITIQNQVTWITKPKLEYISVIAGIISLVLLIYQRYTGDLPPIVVPLLILCPKLMDPPHFQYQLKRDFSGFSKYQLPRPGELHRG
jgi:hypothetical protein